MCGFRKCPYSPPQKGLEIPGVGGWDLKHKNFRCMKLNLNCQRGVGVLEKIPYVGEGGMDTYWNPRMAKGPSIHFLQS